MDLSALIDSAGDGQVVEIYVCPTKVGPDTNPIPVGWPKAPVPRALAAGGHAPPPHRSRLHEYHHRDMTYTYDLDNDAQRVVRKTLRREAYAQNLYAASYEEDVLPAHRFPCTSEITCEGALERASYRVNNRMFLYVDAEPGGGPEYMYVRYQHAPNVDLTRMQADLERLLSKIGRG